jgi:predicted RNase H-like HicB family nuclease
MDYTTIIFQDTTTDGDPCWVGITPALPGCLGLGMTEKAP